MSDENNTKVVPASMSEGPMSEAVTGTPDDQNSSAKEKIENSQIELNTQILDSVKSVSDEAIDSGLKTRTCEDSANTPDDDFELKWDDDDDDDPISFDFDKHNQSTYNTEFSSNTENNDKVVNVENVENVSGETSQLIPSTIIDNKSNEDILHVTDDDVTEIIETVKEIKADNDEKVVSALIPPTIVDNKSNEDIVLVTDDDVTEIIDNIKEIKADIDEKVVSAVALPDTTTDTNIDILSDNNKTSTPVKPLACVIESKNEEGSSSSTLDSSQLSIKPLDHGLNKPDFMIEIPTQELIDCEDLDSDSEMTKAEDSCLSEDNILEESAPLIESKLNDNKSQMTKKDDSTDKLVVNDEKVVESVLSDTAFEPIHEVSEVISDHRKITEESNDCAMNADSKTDEKQLQKPKNSEVIPQTTDNIILLDDADEKSQLESEDFPVKTAANEIIEEIHETPKTSVASKLGTNLQDPEKTDNICEIQDDIISLDDDDDECDVEPAVSNSSHISKSLSDSKIDASFESEVKIENVDKKSDKNESLIGESDTVILIDDIKNKQTDESDPKEGDKIEGLKTKIEVVAAIKSILPEDITDLNLEEISEPGPSNLLTDELKANVESKVEPKSDMASTTDLNSLETNDTGPSNSKADDVKQTNENLVDVVPKDDTVSNNIIESDLTKETQEKELTNKETISSDHVDTELKVDQAFKVVEPTPSTSKMDAAMMPDPSNDDSDDTTDTMGLLAVSSRVMEDDEEPEPDEEDDCDDDDDFDPDDDNSNQLLTVENSEDSNPQQSDDTKDAQDDEKEMEKEEEKIGEEITVDRMDIDEVSVDVNETTIEDTIGEGLKEIPVKGSQEAEDLNKSEKEKARELATDKGPTVEEDCAQAVISKDTSKAKEDTQKSPSRTHKLEVARPSTIVNIVELEESSSEDDVQEVPKVDTKEPSPSANITTVNIPKDIEVMCSGENTSDIVTKKGEVVISGVPKAPVHKPARLNTSEVTIKTRSKTLTESSLSIPELSEKAFEKIVKNPDLEIVSLDSDDDEKNSGNVTQVLSSLRRCINQFCNSPLGVVLHPCTASIRALYATVKRDQKRGVCEDCLLAAQEVSWQLVEGIKNMDPLLKLQMKPFTQEMVEISDSESDDDEPDLPKAKIGKTAAEMLESQLVDILNETWIKYKMDDRLKETESELMTELEDLQKDSEEIGKMLKDCEDATDKLRNELYATFEPKRKELCPITIFDTPNNIFSCLENDIPPSSIETRQSKRRMSSASETPSKRPAIPMGYSPLVATNSTTTSGQTDVQNEEELDKDVSVVQLSAEAAPADLPPVGEPNRAPLKAGAAVYAMRHAFGSWLKAKLLDVQPVSPYTVCRVKFDHKIKSPFKVLTARCLAYPFPSEVRMTIGTRVIALFRDQSAVKRESFYSGIVAEVPNPVNKYRYLIFFDDGYAQYVQHCDTRLVCQSSPLVWEEVHPFSREFVKEYLMAYPERPMVRLHAGQSLKAEWNGKWWASKVMEVDASLVEVYFEEDRRREWIYRGSTRLAPLYLELQAAERHRNRALPRSKAVNKSNMPYVYYSRDEQTNKQADTQQTQQQQNEEIRRQRSVAKKSTSALNVPQAPPQTANLDAITSRLVYYTPKNAVKPYKMTRHTCGPSCRRTDVLALKELRTYNPLAKPLLSGWERQLVRQRTQKLVMYRAPCGRRIRNLSELHAYLRLTNSELAVDLFDFSPNTHCLAEFVLNKCRVTKKDLSHGKENVPVPCVNYYDDSLPEFCSYNTERTPTAGVPLNLDPEFLCGCDCEDDCEDKSKCACWRLTLEGARTIGMDDSVGYQYKRLPDPLPSGIYECNSRCKCKQTCLNRVAQQPLQLKLQVFKTLSRGWGIRALNDVPKGSFLCVYAGNLLTDATANLDGLNEGDEYLAELDYIEVVEQMKEGYEEDIPEADKRLDEEESETSSSEEETEQEKKGEKEADDDFEPGYLPSGPGRSFSKRLRKREKKKNKEESELQKSDNKQMEKEERGKGDDCITISDDEEVREPARFNAQAGMGDNAFVSKHKSVRSHFGKDEACYIMDAKVQGNIGRYLNHSCQPNVFVQNVFVDTHDPRFPWVAFFALCHIKAGTELTWNYNYDIGSVPEKILYCHCGAPNCRGRLL